MFDYNIENPFIGILMNKILFTICGCLAILISQNPTYSIEEEYIGNNIRVNNNMENICTNIANNVSELVMLKQNIKQKFQGEIDYFTFVKVLVNLINESIQYMTNSYNTAFKEFEYKKARDDYNKNFQVSRNKLETIRDIVREKRGEETGMGYGNTHIDFTFDQYVAVAEVIILLQNTNKLFEILELIKGLGF